MNIEAIKNDVLELSLKQNWAGSSASYRMLRVFGEMGEVAQEVALHTSTEDATPGTELAYEVYDVLWNLVSLADKLDVPLSVPEQKYISSVIDDRYLVAMMKLGQLSVEVARYGDSTPDARASFATLSAALNVALSAVYALPGLPPDELEALFREKAMRNLSRTWATSATAS